MMLRVDRDSVCMGDDVDGHAVELDVDGESTVGAVVADLLTRYPLASVSGEVAWRIELRSGRHEIVDGQWRSPTYLELALLHVPYPRGGRTFIPLAPSLLDAPFGDTLRALGDGPTWVHFAYLSDGARVRQTELAQHLAAAAREPVNAMPDEAVRPSGPGGPSGLAPKRWRFWRTES